MFLFLMVRGPPRSTRRDTTLPYTTLFRPRLSGERFEWPPPLLPQKAGFESAGVGDATAESAQHDRLIADRERLGPVNLVAADELVELDTERERSAAEIEELTQAVNRLRGSIGSLNREGRARLLAAFEAVDRKSTRLNSSH